MQRGLLELKHQFAAKKPKFHKKRSGKKPNIAQLIDQQKLKSVKSPPKSLKHHSKGVISRADFQSPKVLSPARTEEDLVIKQRDPETMPVFRNAPSMAKSQSVKQMSNVSGKMS